MRLISPILAKETTQLATGRGILIAKLVVLSGLLLTSMLILAVRHLQTSNGDDDSIVGQVFFYAVAFVELTGLLLVAPLITAGCVCGEREANTLGLLFLTRLTSLQIVQDKGLSRLLFLFLLVLVSLPFLFAALLFGGVETGQVINVFGNLLAATLLAGGCALFASARVKRYPAAVVISYVLLGLWLIGLPMAIGIAAGLTQLLVGNNAFSSEVFEFLITVTQPYVSIGISAAPAALRSTPWVAWTWVGNVVSGGAVYAIAVAFAAWRLRHLATDDSLPQAHREHRPWWWLTRDLWTWLAVLHPLWLLPRAKRPRGNAIYWKEAQSRHDSLKNITANLALAIVVVPPFLAACAALVFDASTDDLPGFWLASYFGTLPLAALLLVVLAASAITRERHGQTLELLLTTRITGKQFIRGHLLELAKYAAVLGALAYGYYVCCALHLPVGSWQGRHEEERLYGLVLLPFCLAVYLLFIIAVGLTCSLRAKTTGRALAKALAMLLAVGLAPLLPLFLVLVMNNGSENAITAWLLAAWPPFWLVILGIGENIDNPQILKDYWALWLAGNLLLYGGVAVWLLRRLVTRFDARVGRQGG